MITSPHERLWLGNGFAMVVALGVAAVVKLASAVRLGNRTTFTIHLPLDKFAMPKVSVIVPCYNEQATIRLLLVALRSRPFRAPKWRWSLPTACRRMARGMRSPNSRRTSPTCAYAWWTTRFVPSPSGLNRAIEASRGSIIVRLDAHSKPYPDYVANCVKALDEGRGDNVGGVWEIQPGADTWVANPSRSQQRTRLGWGTRCIVTPDAPPRWIRSRSARSSAN
jgi:cellulose synthase/poly-beta-1,6-N-acetylglucosamine synthase-like glycosyltransferase